MARPRSIDKEFGSKQVTTRLSVSMLERAKQISEAQGKTVSQVIREALERGISR